MSAVTAKDAGYGNAVAVMGILFAVLVAMSQASDAAIEVLVSLGWVMPLLFLAAFFSTSADMVAVARGRQKPEAETSLPATVMKSLGSLVLLLASCWGYASFGLGRLVGEPSLAETMLTVSMLVGSAGLLLQQRWAGVLVCVAGWCWLGHLLWMAATSPEGGSGLAVPLSFAALVLPLTGAVAASWRQLKVWI